MNRTTLKNATCIYRTLLRVCTIFFSNKRPILFAAPKLSLLWTVPNRTQCHMGFVVCMLTTLTRETLSYGNTWFKNCFEYLYSCMKHNNYASQQMFSSVLLKDLQTEHILQFTLVMNNDTKSGENTTEPENSTYSQKHNEI